jgi:hypothetical protein
VFKRPVGFFFLGKTTSFYDKDLVYPFFDSKIERDYLLYIDFCEEMRVFWRLVA